MLHGEAYFEDTDGLIEKKTGLDWVTSQGERRCALTDATDEGGSGKQLELLDEPELDFKSKAIVKTVGDGCPELVPFIWVLLEHGLGLCLELLRQEQCQSKALCVQCQLQIIQVKLKRRCLC